VKESLRDTPGSMLLSPKTTMRRELVARVEGCLYLYSPSFLEEKFSETGLLHCPILENKFSARQILGSSVCDIARFLQQTCLLKEIGLCLTV